MSRLLRYRPLEAVLSAVGLCATAPLLIAGVIAARTSTGASGIFHQRRVGRHGEPFTIYKLRTMTPGERATDITVAGDPAITRAGALIRRAKIDELPQLLNVVRGEMSIIGPRPDVPGFADLLEGEDRIVLSVRPGITGPASLMFRNEEELLQCQADPEGFTNEIVFPMKTAINRAWIENGTWRDDLRILVWTIVGTDDAGLRRMCSRWGVDTLALGQLWTGTTELPSG